LLTTTQPFSLRVTAASLASPRNAFTGRVEVCGLVEALQIRSRWRTPRSTVAGLDQVDELGADSG
jgi:hypothetical protein